MAVKLPLVLSNTGFPEEKQAADTVAVAASIVYTLAADGILRVISGLDKTPAVAGGTISVIKVFRELAGTAGSTIIDINKNGTTLFTTQSNRPSFLFSNGNDLLVSVVPEVTSVLENDVFSFDIDSVENDTPANIRIEIVVA